MYQRRGTNVYSKCVYDAVRADLAERPLRDDATARQVGDEEALRHAPFLEDLGRRLDGGFAFPTPSFKRAQARLRAASTAK